MEAFDTYEQIVQFTVFTVWQKHQWIFKVAGGKKYCVLSVNHLGFLIILPQANLGEARNSEIERGLDQNVNFKNSNSSLDRAELRTGS